MNQEVMDLLEEFPPRKVMRHELRKGETDLQPFDFFMVENWRDMEMMAESTHEQKDDFHLDGKLFKHYNNLNPIPYHCSHKNDDYQKSVYVMLPYTLDVSFQELMSLVYHVYQDKCMEDFINEF